MQRRVPLGPEVEDVFHTLQRAVTPVQVLQLPDFNKLFDVECDVSGSSFGVVHHQGTSAVTFFSRSITARNAKLAAYKRELIGLIHVVSHWRPNLWDRSFLIKNDQYSYFFARSVALHNPPTRVG
jgi:hypothetical protein